MTQTTHTLQSTSTETKVYNLTVELEDLKKRKRAFVKEYNSMIKDLQEEIKDLLLDPSEKIELP